MSFAFMPLYTGDYLKDTRGLSMAGNGCYLLLLMFCWDSQGPLPLDEDEIAEICKARSQDERGVMQKVLGKHFTRMEDGWYNRRAQREIERAQAISLKRKSAGAKGFQAKARQLPSKSLAKAQQVPLHSQSQSQSQPEDLKPLASRPKNTGRSAGDVVISIPSNRGEEIPVHQGFLSELEAAYPDVDGPATLKEIRAWCISNPRRCKTESGMSRFINSWFARLQNA